VCKVSHVLGSAQTHIKVERAKRMLSLQPKGLVKTLLPRLHGMQSPSGLFIGRERKSSFSLSINEPHGYCTPCKRTHLEEADLNMCAVVRE
jgi:hypothetical protein